MPFDITSLYTFAPAQYQCEKCLALLTCDLYLHSLREDVQSLTCPICHVVYQPTKAVSAYDWNKYFNRRGPTCLNAKDALAQAHQLAEITAHMGFYQQYPENMYRHLVRYSPLRGLLVALSVVQKFVHFTTYGGIPHILIGALKVTAQRVCVRGIVSGTRGEMLSENTVSELTDYRDEAPEMHVKIYDSSLRGCLKTWETSQATDHEVDHRHADHGFARLGQILIIFG